MELESITDSAEMKMLKEVSEAITYIRYLVS